MDSKELYEIYMRCGEITTDSRNCPQGSMFMALKGESFDGNRFAVDAFEKGCSVAVVDNADVLDEFSALRNDSPSRWNDKQMVLVPDTLQAYKDLAREHRRRFNIPVLGITGTNGKTTTKELIAAVLRQKYNVMATEGNFNNDVGVPKTLFRLDDSHEIAVVEMGASHPGDIKTLAETAEPTCGLITNVGKAHLLGFGSFEGVIKTKGELYENLATRAGSTIFVDAGNEHLMNILPQDLNIVRYGKHGEAEHLRVAGEAVSCEPFLELRWKDNESANPEWHTVQTHLIGAYNLTNALAAVAVGLFFGVPEEAISQAIAGYEPHNNRSQFVETERNSLIVDAYNANPTSMKVALDNFEAMTAAPKMAILGEMRELGEDSVREHDAIVAHLMHSGIEEVWLVGEEFSEIPCSYRKFRDVEEVKAAIAEHCPEGYCILIKGSNGNRLFELPPLL